MYCKCAKKHVKQFLLQLKRYRYGNCKQEAGAVSPARVSGRNRSCTQKGSLQMKSTLLRASFAAISLTMICQVLVTRSTAELVTRTLTYGEGDPEFVGYVVSDDRFEGERPGVLVIHEWWGLNEYARDRAEQLARLGYVAFAADMYGDGVNTQDPDRAAELAGRVRGNRGLMRRRVTQALKVLRRQPGVDGDRTAAIGFCFGGTVVLELAYSGADIDGVVSFHGGLTAPAEADLKGIQASLLVLHGSEDTHVSREEMNAFQQSVEKAGVDWHMVVYGGAVHSFTNPDAGRDPSDGVAYDPVAAERSWKHMDLFFDELFKNR